VDRGLFSFEINDLSHVDHCGRLRFRGVTPKRTTLGPGRALWTTGWLCQNCPQSCALTGGETAAKDAGNFVDDVAQELSILLKVFIKQRLAVVLHSSPGVVHRVAQDLWGEACNGVNNVLSRNGFGVPAAK